MALSKIINRKKEYVFSGISEFNEYFSDELEIPNIIFDWRKAADNDWVMTDDNQICRILKRGEFKSGQVYIRTVLGTYNVSSNRLMVGKPPKNIYSFKSDKFSYKQVQDRDKSNANEILFAKYVANGYEPKDAYLKIFRTNNSKYAKYQANALLKTERISKLVSEEIKKSLGRVGIDEDYLLENTKFVIENYDARDSDKLRALEMLMKIVGMFPSEKKSESLTVFQGFTREQLKQLKDSEVRMIAHVEEKDV